MNMNISTIKFVDKPIDNTYKNEFNEFVKKLNPNNFIEDKKRTKDLLDQMYNYLLTTNIPSVISDPNTLITWGYNLMSALPPDNI